LVTMKDVAKIVGCTEATVSRVLSKPEGESPISKPLQDKIRMVADKLGYQPNLMARGLATRKTDNIGVVLNCYEHLTHPVMMQTIAGIAKAVSVSNYSLSIFVIDQPGREQKQLNLASLFARRQVDGLLIAAHDINALEILELVKQEFPFVLTNMSIYGIETNTVSTDSNAYATAVVEYLYNLGHREIAFLPGPSKYGPNPKRRVIAGIESAAAKIGLRLGPSRLILTEYDRDAAYKVAKELLQEQQRPTAFYAGDDAMAMGIYYAAVDLGLVVPQELSIISGADTYVTQLAPVPITSIHAPHQEIGYRAAQLLMEILAGKEGTERVIVPYQITERQSCASIK
jgi:LacI family transcriptional regulator